MKPLPPHGDSFLEMHTGADGSPRTRLSYRTALGAFWEYRLTQPTPERYGPDTLVGFFQHLDEADRAPDTKRLYIGVARKFLSFLEADGLLTDTNVAAMERGMRVKVGRKRLAKRRRHASPWVYLIVETAHLLAQRLPPEDLSEERRKQLRLIALRDYAIVCTLLSTGARVSELIGLTRGAVKHGKTSAVPVLGKGGKRRVVRLDADSQRAIQTYLHARTDTNPALFVSHPNGRPKVVEPKIIELIVKYLWDATRQRFPNSAEAQTVKISPHIFRHNVGASLAAEGAHPNTIRDYLGHASVKTTEVYQEDTADERVMDDVATYTPERRHQIADAKILLDLSNPPDSKDD